MGVAMAARLTGLGACSGASEQGSPVKGGGGGATAKPQGEGLLAAEEVSGARAGTRVERNEGNKNARGGSSTGIVL